MAEAWAIPFYQSKAWRKVRLAYLKSQHYVCERCRGGALIVHHRVYLTPANIDDAQITLSWDSLEAICEDCHNREHHGSKEGVTVEGIVFTADGQVIRAR